MLTFPANIAQPTSTVTTITVGWFREKIGFVNEANSTLWSVKSLKHETWSSSPDALKLLQRLVTSPSLYTFLHSISKTLSNSYPY